MNILFMNSISAHKFGGGEKWMAVAAKGLSEKGHKVILASRRHSEILRRAEALGVATRELTIHGDCSPIKTLQIAKFLKQQKMDVLICNLNKDVRVAGLAARLIGSPVVIARHGILLCGKKLKHKIALTKLTDGILTNTQTIKKAYADYGWFDDNFVKVLYNGIEDKTSVKAFDFASEFGNKKVILSAGRLADQKGFSYLIEAAAILKDKCDDLVFVIAGQGKLEHALKKQVEQHRLDNFHFWGFREDVDSLMKGCDLFVLPSLYEGMPNAVMEAMAVGKAVVSTDVNGARELMIDGETGVIVPPRDSTILAESIRTLINQPQLLKAYGEAGQARVLAHFTIPQMVENLETYFLQKINDKANQKE